MSMTKAEREQLSRLARMRARQAKSEAVQREKVLLSEAEDLMAAEFSARDELWSEATAIAEEAVQKANEVIVARCVDLGIPATHAPKVHIGWQGRSGSFDTASRRAELRKLAQSKLTALTATAKTIIDGQLLETETALIADSLESDEARTFLDAMPTAEQLMPSLSLEDLGVKHWQPPEGIASALLSPSSATERKRRQVLRAIEAHPGESDRAIARLAGVDHKTVARLRGTVGELPAADGEFPNA